jgi:alpha-beta hydrolase superfamily lysophospholipase
VSDTPTPVVFIHGLWLHAASWQPWIEVFQAAGYAPVAPGWPGEPASVDGSRRTPESVADVGIEEVTAHFAGIIDGLPSEPIIIGHSFGGMIAEKLLGEGRGAAAVAIDAAQIKGVLPLPLSALHATLPVFRNPANKHRSVMLTRADFRYAFGNALGEDESDALWEQWVVPSPGRPLFEAAAANFSLHSPAAVNTHNGSRGPLLLVMGGKDHTVPEVITKATARLYRNSGAETAVIEFPDRGHSLTVDHGWRTVADVTLRWLAEHGLGPDRVAETATGLPAVG